MPLVGSISDPSVTPDRSTLTFGLDGIEKNVTFYRAEGARLVPLGLADATLPAAASLTVVQETATSADGTKVPLTITAPKGPVKPLPTLLGTYASYGISGEPYYSPSVVVWVTRGGVSAECHARGGGEKGRAWHEAGRSANKVNSMADVIACGERLVQLGYTTPKLMGLWSGSAGGLLVTPVGLKRPDLFAAVVTSVGVVNPTRLAVANNGPNQFAEMGDPNTDDGFKALAAQDSTLLLPQSRPALHHWLKRSSRRPVDVSQAGGDDARQVGKRALGIDPLGRGRGTRDRVESRSASGGTGRHICVSAESLWAARLCATGSNRDQLSVRRTCCFE